MVASPKKYRYKRTNLRAVSFPLFSDRAICNFISSIQPISVFIT